MWPSVKLMPEKIVKGQHCVIKSRLYTQLAALRTEEEKAKNRKRKSDSVPDRPFINFAFGHDGSIGLGQ